MCICVPSTQVNCDALSLGIIQGMTSLLIRYHKSGSSLISRQLRLPLSSPVTKKAQGLVGSIVASKHHPKQQLYTETSNSKTVIASTSYKMLLSGWRCEMHPTSVTERIYLRYLPCGSHLRNAVVESIRQNSKDTIEIRWLVMGYL